MPFVPNFAREELVTQRGIADPPVAWPFVDELYDYIQLFQTPTIATLPGNALSKQVAIVGAGPAGMAAAYELLKVGLTPVVFEASDRIGGRNWSQDFQGSDVIAEMGAMRVPTVNKVFYTYAQEFNLAVSTFPDPGKVPTLLYYENQIYQWNMNGQNPPPPPPGPFAQIASDFNGFVAPLLNKIWGVWNSSNLTAVQQIWQSYIEKYKDKSFYEVLVDGIPEWSTEDLNAFGALGMGSGGFGPLYSVGFLELLRILVNQFENDQQLIQYGIGGLTDGFYTNTVTWPNGQKVSLQSMSCVKLGTTVQQIEYDGDTGQVAVQWSDGGPPETTVFDAVIVATTTRSMELIGLTMASDSPNPILTEPEETAIRNLHLMESSKMFIRTQSKFWLDQNGNPIPGMPQAIQTDELPRQVYCLDYPQTDNGVVLISYTWGDDSAKLLALEPSDRFWRFKNIIAVIHPAFAAQLDPLNGEILNVDWETESGYYGAFKLQFPGQDSYVQNAYFQFQSVLDSQADRGVYLAGDSVSWAGGWTEGALHTGLNAACAVLQRLGGTFPNGVKQTPLAISPNLYAYADV